MPTPLCVATILGSHHYLNETLCGSSSQAYFDSLTEESRGAGEIHEAIMSTRLNSTKVLLVCITTTSLGVHRLKGMYASSLDS